MFDTATPNTITWAEHYASRGFRVIPLRHKDKTPILKWKDASTTDLNQIKHLSAVSPINIGIAPSNDNGLVVIDVDKKSDVDGYASLAGLEARLGALPRDMVVRTGSGGMHIYTKVPDPAVYARINNSAGTLAKGIDVRANGGYVVAPPSVHANGNEYTWVAYSEVLPELPSAWVDAVATPRSPGHMLVVSPGTRPARGTLEVGGLLRKLAQQVVAAPRGTRNDTLYRTAFSVGGLVGGGCLDHHEAESLLEQAAVAAGLFADGEERKSRDTIRRALEAGAKRPWVPSRNLAAGWEARFRPANDNAMESGEGFMFIDVSLPEPQVGIRCTSPVSSRA